MALFDVLIGNLDRHNKNFLIQKSDSGTITEVYPIDNANSFPVRAFSDKSKDYAGKKQYAWAKMAFAKHPFCKELKREIKSFLSEDRVELIISCINDNPKTQKVLTKDSAELIKKRAKVLNMFVEMDLNLSEIVNYKTRKSLERF